MTATSFPAALTWVRACEGGFVNAPNDHGHATNEGITQATLAAWRGCDVTEDDVACIQPDEVAAIYRANYWDAIAGDLLPAGVDLSVFDCAVLSGPKRAIRWLQYAARSYPDGSLGAHPAESNTIKAVHANDPESLVLSIAALRAAFYRQIVANDPTQAKWLQGWLNRAQLTKDKSLTLIGNTNV